MMVLGKGGFMSDQGKHRMVAFVDKQSYQQFRAILTLAGTNVSDWIRSQIQKVINENTGK